MRVLVTGGFGNIGRSALGELRRCGHRVRVLSPPRQALLGLARALDVEPFAGSVCRLEDVRAATRGQDVVVHLAAVIPPASDEQPERARAVNLDGTRNVVEALREATRPPRLLFASTFDVYGPTTHLPPPRRLDDPVQPTDGYSRHKIAGEEMVRASGLTYSIFRFSDVPMIALRPAHPIMFEIPLDTRIETLHTRDAGLAVANALGGDAAWDRTLLVGGGGRCQVTFGDYMARMLTAVGIGPLPAEAFGTRPYYTDWLDTAETESLLRYQRHSFDDIVRDIASLLGPRRHLVTLLRPLLRRRMLALSPYWRARKLRSRTAPRP
ncbi:MAG TPA: NAD(P)-dependent oxidoreductase [Vicinamibacteria bacterium]|nr:NAD(P)-dependent oxidoreductase [Vicinamibacteria bacterium]